MSATMLNDAKLTKDKDKKTEEEKNELSEEDKLLQDELNLLVERLVENDTSAHPLALASLRDHIRASTTSMTNVPKPLKFMRSHYDTMKEVYEKIDIAETKKACADIVSVLAMTLSEGRECLKYRLRGSQGEIGLWGHEYVRHLAGEIAAEWAELSPEDAEMKVQLVDLAREIVPYNMAHNAEAETCDLLMEIERLDLLEQYVDESAYPRVCLYLTSCVPYVPDPENTTLLQCSLRLFKRFGQYPQALRLAMQLNDPQLIENVFTSCKDLLAPAVHYPVFTIYAQKMCLEERAPCERAWISERVLGYQLTGKAAKGRPAVRVSSRQECLALCLEQQNTEGGIPCRSANYNNQTGECELFEMDRTTLGSEIRKSFRRAKELGAEYMENACVDEPSRLCQFRSLPGVLLKTADSVLRDVGGPDECRELCLSSVSSGASAPFRCRSYDWGSAGERVCRLSHLSAATATHVPSAYIPVPEANTWELSACYNVSVECGARGMVARVAADRQFGGKIYARGNPKSCANDVTAVMRFYLELPYDDVDCGVRRGEARVEDGASGARSGRKSGKDSLSRKTRSTGGLGGGIVGRYTTDIAIQHHDFIVTSADLGLAVTCQYDLTNKTVSNEVDLRVSGGAVDGWPDDTLPAITEEVVVSSPDVIMKIVQRGEEEWGKSEGTAASAQVGDPLSLRFEIPEDSPFEIFVRHLVAMDGGDGGQIVLVDEEGCPTDQFIMGPLRKSTNSPKVLIADFDAFKFPTSEVVQFRALVTPCMPSCEPVRCQRYNDPQTLSATGDDLRNGAFINSYGRKRRRRGVEIENSVENAEQYASEQAHLAFQNVFEEEVEEAMQDGLTEAFHLAVHSLFGRRKKRSAEEPMQREDNLLLVQSICISGRFGPEKRESVDEGVEAASCVDTKGLAFGSAAFVLAQVAIMVVWAPIRRNKDKKEEKKLTQHIPPREVLFHGEAVWGMKRQRF